MRSTRCCSRNGCDQPAVATLTYIYSDSTAVVGPLAVQPEPHTYDLCQGHAHNLTAPRGWTLVRHDGDFTPPAAPADDLLALADAVREVTSSPPARSVGGRPSPGPAGPPPSGAVGKPSPRPGGRRGHLRSLPPG